MKQTRAARKMYTLRSIRVFTVGIASEFMK